MWIQHKVQNFRHIIFGFISLAQELGVSEQMSTEMSKQMSSFDVIITIKTAVDAILRSAVAPANEHHRVTVQALGKRFTPTFFPVSQILYPCHLLR